MFFSNSTNSFNWTGKFLDTKYSIFSKRTTPQNCGNCLIKGSDSLKVASSQTFMNNFDLINSKNIEVYAKPLAKGQGNCPTWPENSTSMLENRIAQKLATM